MKVEPVVWKKELLLWENDDFCNTIYSLNKKYCLLHIKK